MAKLSPAFHLIALDLQEAAADVSHDNIRQRLQQCIREVSEYEYAYVVDVFGDGESGEVVYSCGDGGLKKASYYIGSAAGKATCAIDAESAVAVVPRTTYEEMAEDEDHYTAMESQRLYAEVPAYERFIPKDERQAAPEGSFAGKAKSFPILKPTDVMAAVRSLGRAGAENFDTATLKKNIIRIAKAKGWGKQLPKAWREADLEESATAADLRLIEGAAWLDQIELKESAKADYAVKLIAPGKGSSAFYPAEVLKRDGPQVFKAGTHMYWNHPTDAEEAARPEGDLDALAGVLTSDAYFEEAGKEGPGLYARAKVFADYAEKLADRAPHIGISIRASGVAEGGLREGRPVVARLVAAESTDFVTRAGAGGLILTEAARPPIQNNEGGESAMEQAEITKLKESVRKSHQRLALYEARDMAGAEISRIRLPEAARQRVVGRVVGMAPIDADGNLDAVKFKALIEAEAKEEAEYIARLTEGRVVTGMGQPVEQPADPAKFEEAFQSTMNDLAGALGLSESGRKAFAGVQ